MEDWKKDLKDLFEQEKTKKEQKTKVEAKKKEQEPRVKEFYSSTVIPAFEELKVEFGKYGRVADIFKRLNFASFHVSSFDTDQILSLELEASISPDRVYLVSTYNYRNTKTGECGASSADLKKGDRDISEISKEDIVNKFVQLYKEHIKL